MSLSMSRRALDVEMMLNQAERELLIEGKVEFTFPLRKRPGFEDYYECLEDELRENAWIKVLEYREVKEGWARISRPSLVRFDSEALLRMRPHLRLILEEVVKWRAEFVAIDVQLALKLAFQEMVAEPSLTKSCLQVLTYLISHRELIGGLLPRQIQHGNSSKLIGKEPLLLRLFSLWRGESATWKEFFRYFDLADKPVEFRFYAPRLRCQDADLERFHGLLASEWAESLDFSGLKGTLIVENLETFYSEAALSAERLIIWGGGWKVSVLRSLQDRLPRPIVYWGDIDKEGYEIYGHLKGFVPELQSIFMDHATIKKYRHLGIRKDAFLGPFRFAADLQAEYQDVCISGLCIEQEKIHDRS